MNMRCWTYALLVPLLAPACSQRHQDDIAYGAWAGYHSETNIRIIVFDNQHAYYQPYLTEPSAYTATNGVLIWDSAPGLIQTGQFVNANELIFPRAPDGTVITLYRLHPRSSDPDDIEDYRRFQADIPALSDLRRQTTAILARDSYPSKDFDLIVRSLIQFSEQ